VKGHMFHMMRKMKVNNIIEENRCIINKNAFKDQFKTSFQF